MQQLGHPEKSDYIFASCKNGFGTNGFEPIPLTAEILEKAGFVSDMMADGFLSYSKDGVEIDMPYFEFFYGESSIEVKYVHQLQNLIHSLSGQELEIEL